MRILNFYFAGFIRFLDTEMVHDFEHAIRINDWKYTESATNETGILAKY